MHLPAAWGPVGDTASRTEFKNAQPGAMCHSLSPALSRGGGRPRGSLPHLEVGHGDLVLRVTAVILNGLEELAQGAGADARLPLGAQHGVGLPTAWGRGWGSLRAGTPPWG